MLKIDIERILDEIDQEGDGHLSFDQFKSIF